MPSEVSQTRRGTRWVSMDFKMFRVPSDRMRVG